MTLIIWRIFGTIIIAVVSGAYIFMLIRTVQEDVHLWKNVHRNSNMGAFVAALAIGSIGIFGVAVLWIVIP